MEASSCGGESRLAETERPAFYAAGPGGWRDWWTLLHPPYTAWHLSYVVIGSTISPAFDSRRLVATVVAFFLAVGIAAHALDELNGRPLRTRIPDPVLWASAIAGVAGAVAIGILGVTRVGAGLVPFIILGTFFILAYNLEWFGGRFHTDQTFAAAWGAFPVVTAYFAQAERLTAVAAAAAIAAYALSGAQRTLSTPARRVRRRVKRIEGVMLLNDGTTEPIDATRLLQPLEGALRALSAAVVALAAALLLARLI